MKNRATAAFIAAFILASILTCEAGAQPGMGDKAPEINVQNWLNTMPLSLKALRGRIVVLEFWATWCPPCRT